MVDIRREVEHIQRKGMDFVERTTGEAVLWFEYDAVGSEMHPVYDEDSLTEYRKWRPGILVPTLFCQITEGNEEPDREGRIVTATLRCAVSMERLRETGVSNPTDSRRHLNDVLVYAGWQWNVRSYDRRARLRDTLVVGVNAVRIRPEDEFPLGQPPTFVGFDTSVRDRGFPDDRDQTWSEYELPAYQGP